MNQLLSQNRDLVRYFHDKFLSSGQTTLESINLGKQLLKQLCEQIPKLFIIIDGLDECESQERKLILSFYTDMVGHCDSSQPGKLRLLFVSQDYNDIKKALSVGEVLSLRPSDNKFDIRIYVDHWAAKIRQKHELDGQQIENIKESTCARAQGNFPRRIP